MPVMSTRREFLQTLAALAAAPALQARKSTSQLARYDALGIAELIKKKEITALEAVEDVLKRIAKANPKLNAVLEKNFDFEKARARARAVNPNTPFAGSPVMLKNLVGYADARVDSGSRLNARALAKGTLKPQTSLLVQAMERSGMIVTGLASSPEFGLIDVTEPVLHGVSRNPWNPRHTPGGSSGGSGAVVAAGIVPLAHGSDGGGSIRIPSSHCGVFGLKPTRGRELGNSPGGRGRGNPDLNISSNLCLSRSVRDTAAFLDIVENKDNAALPPVGLVSGPAKKRLKIALAPVALNGKPPVPEVMEGLTAAGKLCEKLGHKVEEAKLPVNGEELMDTFLGFWASGTAGFDQTIRDLLGEGVKREDVLEPWTIALMEDARRRGVDNCVTRAAKLFPEVSRALEKMFAGYDVILSPVARVPAPAVGWHAPTLGFDLLRERLLEDLGYTPLHNIAGTPAMSVPLHWTRAGLPVGMQFAAWRGGEATLLALAYELEQARPWAQRRPPVWAA